ncbi:uncharacterized protein MONBRDRAFT_6535 [Monosiga brevicollis MX1]|uniref:PNPLA domain-containing protein n=1 Tax=Monosiga brevicollis TaxID=81824 RepID=A9UU64_MONBE|nr:uncharacterized protein MONBRDRAFT_6535 [Monosiga brevicollis MX1]EDQ91367.1 predicted protein [Monosiga brevicollis MX1]|eukprot:XP_001743789.1 hypothetical protein [Monosiga brevicollis MX1]
MLRKLLHALLPADAHEICRECLYVAVQPISFTKPPTLVSEFFSKDDLIEALIASCYIPGYLDHGFTSMFRGQPHVDGGFKDLVPRLANVLKPGERGVHVLPFPDWVARALDIPIEIGPSLVPENVFRDVELFRMIFVPPTEADAWRLFAIGQQAGINYLEAKLA